MNAANQEIVTAFEINGMSPEQISEDTGYDLTVVKTILFQSSQQYRKISKKDANLEFTESEADEAKTIILNLAKYSDDEHLQFKAAKFVLEDKKGRLDIQRQLPQLNVNVLNFNEQMKRALAAEQRTIQSSIEDVKELVND